jgi:hypothetical protein
MKHHGPFDSLLPNSSAFSEAAEAADRGDIRRVVKIKSLAVVAQYPNWNVC